MTGRGVALLRVVHDRPGLTRADAARATGIGTGAATEEVARLVEAELLAEAQAEPTGARGRPTRALVPHGAGPLVLAVAISHESWRLAAVELGGRVVESIEAAHAVGPAAPVLATVADAVETLRRRHAGRIRGLGISVPGTVTDGHVVDAVALGWEHVDLTAAFPSVRPLVVGNDATLAAVAEARRGVAREAALAVHVHIDAGLGGAIVDRGRVVAGARGIAGEFGHMPFGDPVVLCPCGAHGCWGTSVDGTAMARLLGAPPPAEPVRYAREVIGRAAAGDPAAMRVVVEVAGVLGRGLAGLSNALDPDLLTLGGLGPEIRAVAGGALRTAYLAGLMRVRRERPPSVEPAGVGGSGPLVGAAELVWDDFFATVSRLG